MRLKFFQVDVFTNVPLGGNPLAVFVDVPDLKTDTLVQIAREMNLSETTFLYPPRTAETDAWIRIFTPEKEIPFAGHPTLGTAHIMRQTDGRTPKPQALTLELGVGPVPVQFERDEIFMQQPLPRFEKPEMNPAGVAAALGLKVGDLDCDFPIQKVSTGFPALLVPLKTLAALERIQLNLNALKPLLKDVDMIYPFTLETGGADSTARVRGFAPFIGIQEDPATGSVAGAMGSYLVHHELVPKNQAESIVLEQGHEIGRPSLIHVRVQLDRGSIVRVCVGGASITVIEGVLSI